MFRTGRGTREIAVIYGELIDETNTAWTLRVASRLGDATELGLFGDVVFPKDRCRLEWTMMFGLAGVTAPRELLVELSRSCFP